MSTSFPKGLSLYYFFYVALKFSIIIVEHRPLTPNLMPTDASYTTVRQSDKKG